MQQTLAQILKHRPLAHFAVEKINSMNAIIDFYIYIYGTRRKNVKIYHNDDQQCTIANNLYRLIYYFNTYKYHIYSIPYIMNIVPFAPSLGAFCRYVILFSAIVQIITLYVILCTRSEERISERSRSAQLSMINIDRYYCTHSIYGISLLLSTSQPISITN